MCGRSQNRGSDQMSFVRRRGDYSAGAGKAEEGNGKCASRRDLLSFLVGAAKVLLNKRRGYVHPGFSASGSAGKSVRIVASPSPGGSEFGRSGTVHRCAGIRDG